MMPTQLMCDGGKVIIESGTYIEMLMRYSLMKELLRSKAVKFSIKELHSTVPYGYAIDCDDANYQNGTARGPDFRRQLCRPIPPTALLKVRNEFRD